MTAAIQHVRVDHRRLHAAVAKQLLDRPNIVPLREQMGRERVTKGVAAHGPGDPGVEHRLADGALDDRLVQMMPPFDPGPRIDAPPLGREDVLPAPLAVGAGVLALERVGEIDAAEPLRDVPVVDPPDAGKPVRQDGARDDRQRDDPVAVPPSRRAPRSRPTRTRRP